MPPRNSFTINIFYILIHKRSDGNGIRHICKECFYKKSRKWFSNNKEKYKQWKREYNHRPYVKEKGKIYRENNKKRINKVANSRIQKDPLLQLSIRLNNHLRNCLKHYDYFAKGEMEELLGCSIERFKFHFELYFLKEMTWDKFKNGEIQIGHVMPRCYFDLSKIEEQKRCYHYTNLRPEWPDDNLKKGSSLDKQVSRKKKDSWAKILALRNIYSEHLERVTTSLSDSISKIQNEKTREKLKTKLTEESFLARQFFSFVEELCFHK